MANVRAAGTAMDQGSIAELAGRPLFEPLRGLMQALPGAGPGGLALLNALASNITSDPVRFVAPDDNALAYEERIVASSEVVTRPGNWHDFFNALVWMRFPHTKRCLAALHAAGMRAPRADGRRGAVCDAATQFDESGVVVAASDTTLLDLLAARRWKELFWTRRNEVKERMRFVVFGHGLYDALRAPFYRICGRAAVLSLPQDCLEASVESLCGWADAILAERFADGTWYPRPRALLALPLLGIPGVCTDNERAQYYDDVVQFRPPPAP
jgi:hypothetical protein